MKLTTNTQLSRTDFPEVGNWINKLLYPLQLFITEIRTALTNQLTFQDNVSCIVRQMPLQAGVTDTDNTVTFPFGLNRQPVYMSIYVTRQDGTYEVLYPQISWNYINSNIVVNGITGLTPGKLYNLNLVVY